MREHIDELLARIRQLENEIEDEYRQHRDDFAARRAQLADQFIAQQRRYKTGLVRFLLDARRIKAAHEHYPKFFDHGDAEAYRQGLERLRRQYDDNDEPPAAR